MAVFTLNRMEVVADDFMDRCAPELRETMTGRLFIPKVEQLVARIDELRVVMNAPVPAKPSKAAMKDIMLRQNDLTAMIHASIEGLAADRNQRKAVQAAVEEARAHVFPKRLSASLSAMVRVDAAQALAPAVEAHAKCLALLPSIGGGTVLERTREHLACADELAKLIAQEATAANTKTRSGERTRNPVALVSEGMNLFKSMRVTLIAEVDVDASLPRDLVPRVFALYEQSLASSRSPKRATRAPAGAADVEGAAA